MSHRQQSNDAVVGAAAFPFGDKDADKRQRSIRSTAANTPGRSLPHEKQKASKLNTKPYETPTASPTNPKNRPACSEFNHRTTTVNRDEGSIHINELPAPTPK